MTTLETCATVTLLPDDDFHLVRHRLDRVKRGRVALVLPWDARFPADEVDFDLLWREAERRQLELAIVSPDPERRALARSRGFPVFPTVERAQQAAVWRSRPPKPVAPPPRPWWAEEVDLRPRPVRPLPRWVDWLKLGFRFLVFLLVIAILAGSGYAIVPSCEMTLVPAGREFTTIVPVSVDPDVETVDTSARLIPARRVGIEVENYAEVETTGVAGVVSGRATGTVLFTNLLVQDYRVPAGTIVRTSSTSYPIRFRTTADVIVPAGGQATAPIEALDEDTGNVGAYQINRVEGVAASAVRVINPEPTSGVESRDVRVVTQADYDRVRRLLMRQLLDQAYDEMSSGSLLDSNEFLLRQSLRIEAVPKEAYTNLVSEQADTVGLDMRVLVSGLAVDVRDAETVAYVALSRRLPPGYMLVDADFKRGEVAEEDIGPGKFTFFITAHGYAAVALDADEAVTLVQGKRLDEARQVLMEELPLAEEPQIALWPHWPDRLQELERVPLLPLRIAVEVIPKSNDG